MIVSIDDCKGTIGEAASSSSFRGFTLWNVERPYLVVIVLEINRLGIPPNSGLFMVSVL